MLAKQLWYYVSHGNINHNAIAGVEAHKFKKLCAPNTEHSNTVHKLRIENSKIHPHGKSKKSKRIANNQIANSDCLMLLHRESQITCVVNAMF